MTLDEALKVLRMCELTQKSLEKDGQELRDIVLSHDPKLKRWITLASDAGINRDAFIDAKKDLPVQVVGAMPGPSKKDNSLFMDKYPQELVKDLRSYEDLVG